MPVGSCLAIPGGSKLEATLALSIVAAHEQKGTWMASQWELRKGCPDGACQEVSTLQRLSPRSEGEVQQSGLHHNHTGVRLPANENNHTARHSLPPLILFV